jgi:uncharacterized protein (TIGR02246 family)
MGRFAKNQLFYGFGGFVIKNMSITLATTVAILCGPVIFSRPAIAAQQERDKMTSEDTAVGRDIRAVFASYETALNRSDAEGSLVLYADDAVLMMPNHATMVGKPAIRAAYEGGAKAIKFDVKFEIKSIVVMAPDWAYARTASTGTMTTRSSGAVTAEANQELFILRTNEKGQWRISVYSFSTVNPE